jgi:predicted HD phosphohydrolase
MYLIQYKNSSSHYAVLISFAFVTRLDLLMKIWQLLENLTTLDKSKKKEIHFYQTSYFEGAIQRKIYSDQAVTANSYITARITPW